MFCNSYCLVIYTCSWIFLDKIWELSKIKIFLRICDVSLQLKCIFLGANIHPSACVALCKYIDFLCAVIIMVCCQLCFSGFLFSSTTSSPQGPLSPHCLREHTRATGSTLNIKVNANFLLIWSTSYGSKAVMWIVIANVSLICIFQITPRRHYV